VKFTVDLPPEHHETPDDEAIVAIDDVPVAPGDVDVVTTTSIEIIPEEVIAAVEAAKAAALEAAAADLPEEPGIPPLPEPVVPLSRHGRRYSDPTEEYMYEPYLKPRPGKREAPEGFWPELIYGVTLTLVNMGDSKPVRARKRIESRIATPVEDGARFVPVVSRKGGVGATTITALLGMALAELRDDRVLAVDAHPDRGTLAERVTEPSDASVRDVVKRARTITSADDMDGLVAHDRTRLDVLASDAHPEQTRPFDVHAYNVVADLAKQFYSVVLTDGATGVLEPVMQAALRRADGLVIVSGGSAEEARLASEIIDWLEANDLSDLAANSIVALNTATTGTVFDDLPQIEAHFLSRVREVVRVPYDEELVAGTPVRFGALRPFTRASARDLAALVMDSVTARDEEETDGQTDDQNHDDVTTDAPRARDHAA
jgi:MinD-like ATPase involved in chromosome partitioning or flagellar assembly